MPTVVRTDLAAGVPQARFVKPVLPEDVAEAIEATIRKSTPGALGAGLDPADDPGRARCCRGRSRRHRHGRSRPTCWPRSTRPRGRRTRRRCAPGACARVGRRQVGREPDARPRGGHRPDQRRLRRPHGSRALHAKGRFYDGTFTASPEAAALCRAAHLQGEPVPVTVRWSNAGGHPRVSDKAPDVRGMAVKFRTPRVTPTCSGRPRRGSRCATPRRSSQLTEAGRASRTCCRSSWPGTRRRCPRCSPTCARGRWSPPHSYAEVTYYPIHAYGWLAPDGARTWVRYVLRPLATPADRLGERSTAATGWSRRWRPGWSAGRSGSTCA